MREKEEKDIKEAVEIISKSKSVLCFTILSHVLQMGIFLGVGLSEILLQSNSHFRNTKLAETFCRCTRYGSIAVIQGFEKL